MANELQVITLDHPDAANTLQRHGALPTGRPITNKKARPDSIPYVLTARGMRTNSILRRDEWIVMDTAVMAAAVQPLNVTRVLMAQNLTKPITNIGQLMAQYPRGGEMTPANISMRLHAAGEKDLIDQDYAGVPIPIIFKPYEIDGRLLATSRLMGQGLDVTNGEAAARVVAEKVEDLIINGDTNINLNGNTIYGLTTHPNRTSDTAANFGGGDWGTIDNVTKTIAGMIAAAQLKGKYGPYGVFASNTQYNQAAMAWFSDGSGNTPAERVRRLGEGSMTKQISFFEPSTQLADGVIALVQLTRDVIEILTLAEYWPVRNQEWVTGDESLHMFKVTSVMTPLVKANYGGKSGIVIATGA